MMTKSRLHTKDGYLELDNEVADFIKMQQDEITNLRSQIHKSNLYVFDLENKLNTTKKYNIWLILFMVLILIVITLA